MNLKEIVPLEWRGQRVLTAKQLAQAYDYDVSVVNYKVRAYSDVFVEGEQYFDLKGSALRDFKTIYNIKVKNTLRLFTKSGAKFQAELLKKIATLNAYKWLEENYFDAADIAPIAEIPADNADNADNALRIVKVSNDNVRGYLDENGTAWLNAEDVARGLGFTQTQNKNGKTYTSIRWETVNRYLADFHFPHQVGEKDFIPENMFYRLAMKAKNAAAEKFQAKVADEILPAIRKTGKYEVNTAPAAVKTPAELVLEVGKTRDAIKSVFGVAALKEGIALAKSIDMVGKHYNTDLSELNTFLPPATHKVGHLTATDIGNKVGISAQAVNAKLKAMGLQYKDDKGSWILTDEGITYGEMIPYVNKLNGHTGYYPLWNDRVLNLFVDTSILPF